MEALVAILASLLAATSDWNQPSSRATTCMQPAPLQQNRKSLRLHRDAHELADCDQSGFDRC
jgi:hypothetical protein